MIKPSVINVELQNGLYPEDANQISTILKERSYHAKIVITKKPSVSREASKDMIKQCNYQLKQILNIC